MRKKIFRVWCGEPINEMALPCNWYLLTQAGELMSYGPIRPPSTQYIKEFFHHIMFWIGIDDRNNTKIFEEDIVRDNKGFSWIVKEGKGYYYMLSAEKDILPDRYNWDFKVEVIGNTYENPELLRR